jgi:hypothetical protein
VMNSRRLMPNMGTSSPEAKAVYRKDAGGFLGQALKGLDGVLVASNVRCRSTACEKSFSRS